MDYKYYKNGNIHIRYDSDIDGYQDEHTYGAMVCVIYNSMLDCFEFEEFDAYAVCLAIMNHAAKDTYDYMIPYDELEKFFSGKWIVLRAECKHAFVHIPRFFRTECTKDENGKKFNSFWLCDKPDDEFIAEMTLFGCMFGCSFPAYAPELRTVIMSVPYGTAIRYE